MWTERDVLYPGLVFLEKVEVSPVSFRAGHRMVDRLHRRLTELSAFVNGWVSGPLNIASLPMRIGPDSQATLERYGEERTFVLPDGTTRVFSFHVKLGLTTRIYVYFRGPGECYIGHIGPHLRTVKFPN